MNTEKINALLAEIRQELAITPYATMATVEKILEIVDLKIADAGSGDEGGQVNWDDVQGKPDMTQYLQKSEATSTYAAKTELLQTITLTGTTNGTGTVEGTSCTITTTAGA